MISFLGNVLIPQSITDKADTVKLQHYKVNSPRKFQVHELDDLGLIQQLAAIIDIPYQNLDFVYFSVCKGAEPHTDALNPNVFCNDTYVIPVILPQGESIISANGWRKKVHIGGVYRFNHNETHSMELEDTDSGCVVIMVAVKK